MVLDGWHRDTDTTPSNWNGYSIDDRWIRAAILKPPKTKKEIQRERANALLKLSHIVYNKTLPKLTWHQRYWRPPEPLKIKRNEESKD